MAVDYMLDASALIALVRQEPGHDVLSRLLENSAISAVSMSETVTKLVQKGGTRAQVEELLRALKLNVVAWDEDLAYRSAGFAHLARERGLSLGDRACLTSAQAFNSTALTTERNWSDLNLPVQQIR